MSGDVEIRQRRAPDSAILPTPRKGRARNESGIPGQIGVLEVQRIKGRRHILSSAETD